MTTFLFVGLGNPGEEYARTRHNIGRMALHSFALQQGADAFEIEKGAKSLLSHAKLGKHDIWMALPETFMNKSGLAVAYLAAKKKVKPEHIVVMYDDMDLPVATVRMAFDRGDGGHHGVESVIKHLKTRAFARIRIGVSPETTSGKLKKPRGDDKVHSFLLKPLRETDLKDYEKVFTRVNDTLATFVEKGREAAMQQCNTAA